MRQCAAASLGPIASLRTFVRRQRSGTQPAAPLPARRRVLAGQPSPGLHARLHALPHTLGSIAQSIFLVPKVNGFAFTFQAPGELI